MFQKRSHFLFMLFLMTLLNNANGSFSTLLNIMHKSNLNSSIIDPLIVTENDLKMQHKLLNPVNSFNQSQRIARKAVLIRKSAPTFLLNIYRNILTKDGTILLQMLPMNLKNLNLRRKDIKIINQSDVIITFGGHNPFSADGQIRNRGRRIWFDVLDVPKEERIIATQLRLYRMPVELKKLNRTRQIQSFTLEVYRVKRTKNGARKKFFLDSTEIPVNYEGWVSLNVTKALRYWLQNPKQNRGLFLRCNPNNQPNRTFRPDDIGIVGILGIPDKQPFMIGFFESPATSIVPNVSPINQPLNVKDDLKNHVKSKNRFPRSVQVKSPATNPDNILGNRLMDSKARSNGRSCRKHELYLSFKELGWDDWIIAPNGFQANYCDGECVFPTQAHINATNHAVVQMLSHLKKPNDIPKPCCAPIQLNPINVIYFLDNSNIALKKYKNMSVSKCGCV